VKKNKNVEKKQNLQSKNQDHSKNQDLKTINPKKSISSKKNQLLSVAFCLNKTFLVFYFFRRRANGKRQGVLTF